MTVFAAAIDDLFADPNLAVDAVYQPPAGGDGIACRIMLRRPDETVEFGGSKFVAGSVIIDVRAAELSPAKGGTLAVGDTVYSVSAVPRQPDPDRLIWRCEATS